MIKSSNENKANNVNGTVTAPEGSSHSVAFGRSHIGQVEAGRHLATDSEDSGAQATSAKYATGAIPKAKDKNINRQREYTPKSMNDIFGRDDSFKRFFTIRSNSSADLRKLNVFKVDDEICKFLNGEPKKVTNNTDGSITIEVDNAVHSRKILALTTLVKEEVQVEEHGKYNESQGVILCDLLKDYSEEEILDGLKNRGVKKVFRFKKKVNDTLKDTSALLLTFDSTDLPERLKIRFGLMVKVRPYIPLPRRCFKCQGYGHVGKFCRSSRAVCVRCGEDAHDDGECSASPSCANCGKPHQANNKECDRYLLEKEIICIKTKEKCTFREAKEIALSRHIKPGLTFANAVSGHSKPMNHRSRDPRREERTSETQQMPTSSPDKATSQNCNLRQAADNNNVIYYQRNTNSSALENINNLYDSPPKLSTKRALAQSPSHQVIEQKGKKVKPPDIPDMDVDATEDMERKRSGFRPQTGEETLIDLNNNNRRTKDETRNEKTNPYPSKSKDKSKHSENQNSRKDSMKKNKSSKNQNQPLDKTSKISTHISNQWH